MWTRKDIKEFKDTLRKEKDTVIKIGSGETISVRDTFVDLLTLQCSSVTLDPCANT